MIRRYIIWRNHHADDRRLLAVVDRGTVRLPVSTASLVTWGR